MAGLLQQNSGATVYKGQPISPIMKNLLPLAFIIIFCFNSSGQPTGKPVTFISIEPVDSAIKKETLYFNGLEWISKHFTNANKVIQISDKEAGLILVKGSFSYRAPGYMLSGTETHTISFMLKFSFKDGKYKLELSDFNDEVLGIITNGDYEDHTLSKKSNQKLWKIVQEETQSNIVSIHKSITEFMQQNKDW
jgi:hypothetical protein